MSALHGPVMVAHCVQVVKVVLRVTAHPVRPSPWRPVGGEAPAALAPLHHVGRHVHACERELHHVLHFHSPVSVLLLQHIKFDIIISHCLLYLFYFLKHFYISTCLKRFR